MRLLTLAVLATRLTGGPEHQREPALVGQMEVAQLHAPVSDRRPQEAPRQRRVVRKTQRAEVGRQVPEPERLRNRAQVLPQARPVGQVQEPLVFLGTHAGGDEILQVSRRIHGRDPAAAGAGQRAGALHHLAQDGIDVQALTDAQTRLAEFREVLPQRLDVPSRVVGFRQLHPPIRWRPARAAVWSSRCSHRIPNTGFAGTVNEW